MEKKKEKKWKNKKFNIFGDVWRIVFIDQVMDTVGPNGEKGWLFGICDYTNKLITISLKGPNNKPLCEWEIVTSIAHECMHAILDSGQYKEQSSNEPLVEFLAKGVLSLTKSKVFDYE